VQAAAQISATAPRVRVAGFWRRAIASAVDLSLLAGAFALLDVIASLLLRRPLPRLRQLGPDYLLDVAVNGDAFALTGMILFAALALLYFIVFHAALGQTVGKRLVGLRVIDGWGERPSLLRAAGRALAYVPSLVLVGLGFLWIAFDRDKRGLHDWLADTYVVTSIIREPR
jgi:uncharacterized RDD family membrane protein YckC